MDYQRTLKEKSQTSGIGLHRGKKVSLTLLPAPINTGIIFRRVDLEPFVDIKVDANLVKETMLCTGLVNVEGVQVATIEHLMSAFAALGIDNVIVEIDAPEIPIMDGSSAPFIYLCQSIGVVKQSALKKYIKIKKNIKIEDGDKLIELRPYNGFKVDFSIDFDHPEIARSNQKMVMDFSFHEYNKNISRARTFGFVKHIESLRENGLALGGSMENAIVLDEYKILNSDGLRFSDEFVRHKILDLIGDLYVLGHPILGECIAHKSGHALNNKLARVLLERQDAWELIEFSEEDKHPIGFFETNLTSVI